MSPPVTPSLKSKVQGLKPTPEEPKFPPIKSRKEAEAVLLAMRKLDADLEKAKAKKQKLEEDHAAKLKLPTSLLMEISQMETELALNTEFLLTWSELNREEFADKQSLELVEGGELRFRIGNRKLDLLAGWTWAKCLKAMQKVKAWRKYIRMKPEVNKELLLQHSANNGDMENPRPPKLNPAKMRKIGVRVWREETFSVQVKPGTLYSTTCQS